MTKSVTASVAISILLALYLAIEAFITSHAAPNSTPPHATPPEDEHRQREAGPETPLLDREALELEQGPEHSSAAQNAPPKLPETTPNQDADEAIELTDLPRNATAVYSRFGRMRDFLADHRPNVAIPVNPGMGPRLAQRFIDDYDMLSEALTEAQEFYGDAIVDRSNKMSTDGAVSYAVPSGFTPGEFVQAAMSGELPDVPRLGPRDHAAFFASPDGLRAHLIREGQAESLDELREYRDTQVEGTADAYVQLLGYFQFLPEREGQK